MKYYDEVKDIFERRRDDIDFILYPSGAGGDTVRHYVNNYVEEYNSGEDISRFITELNRTTMPCDSGLSGDWMAHIRNFFEKCVKVENSHKYQLSSRKLTTLSFTPLDMLTSFFVDDEFSLNIGDDFGIDNVPYGQRQIKSLKDYLCSVSEQLIMWDTITRETTNKKIMISMHNIPDIHWKIFPNSKIITLIPGNIWWKVYCAMNQLIKNFTISINIGGGKDALINKNTIFYPRLLKQWEKDGYILEGLLHFFQWFDTEFNSEGDYDNFDWDKLNKPNNLIKAFSVMMVSPYFSAIYINWASYAFLRMKTLEHKNPTQYPINVHFIALKDIIKTNTLAETLNVSEGGILQKKMTEWHNNNLKQFERYDISIDKMLDELNTVHMETDIMKDRTKIIPFFNRK